MIDPVASLTVTFDDPTTAKDTEEDFLSLKTSGSSPAKVVRDGSFVRTIEPGYVDLEIEFDGGGPVEIHFFGSGWVGNTPMGSRSAAQAIMVQFSGQSEVAYTGTGQPLVRGSTQFVNAAGQKVPPPIFRNRDGKKGFYASEPVWGGLVVSSPRKYQVQRIKYAVSDAIRGNGQDIGDIEPLHVMAQVNFTVATATISRSVQWPQNQIIREKPTKKMRKIEVEKVVEVWRTFPTPSANSDPVPDPRTGRTDYSDVEQTIKIVYGVFEEDKNGSIVIVRDPMGYIVNALDVIVETYQSHQPDNSYLLDRVVRSTEIK